MDTTPKEFKPFLIELQKIREHLEQLIAKLNQQITAVNAAEERREQKRNAQPPWLDPILTKYKQPETERKAEADRQSGIQNSARWAAWFTFGATLLAFIAAAVYAHYAHQTLIEIEKQTPEIRKSADAAKSAADTAHATLVNSQKSFEIDERPYLVVESRHPEFAWYGLVANQKLSANVWFKNIGKGPAIQKITAMHLLNYQVPAGHLSQQDYMNRLRAFTDKWFVQMRRDTTKSAAEIAEYKNGHGEDIAPGDESFASTHDDFVLSPLDLARISNDSNPQGMLLLFIVVSYRDSFGNAYETDACQMYFGSHQEIWHHCPAYNIIH